MKRKLFTIILSLVFAFVIFSGFNLYAAQKFLKFGSASMGGGFYSIGAVLTKVLNDNLKGIKIAHQATGGSSTNCRYLNKGELDIALAQSTAIKDAYFGKGKFKSPQKNIRGITVIYFTRFHVVVRKGSGIKSIADFKGKRIDLGPVGGGIEVNTIKAMKVYGLTVKDIIPLHFSRSEFTEMFKTGRVDGHIWATYAPKAKIAELILANKVRLIPIEEDKIKLLIKENPELAPAVIKGGTYKDHPNDIHTVAAAAWLMTRKDLDPKIVYQIVKIIYDNLDTLRAQHKYFKDTKLESALKAKVAPLHPGAAKFYKEKGLIK